MGPTSQIKGIFLLVYMSYFSKPNKQINPVNVVGANVSLNETLTCEAYSCLVHCSVLQLYQILPQIVLWEMK